MEIVEGEAAPAGWDSWTLPVSGWAPVRLPDDWTARWPQHDGVVWYRLHWHQADARAPIALMLDYTHLASAVYINDVMVARDPSLVEPLSRGWVAAQYFLVSPPLLRAGDNVLLVRVSGLKNVEPGMGVVTRGAPEDVRDLYERSLFNRLYIKVATLALSLALSLIFAFMWILRREETTFGWFALSQFVSAVQRYNLIAEDPWPFASIAAALAFNEALKVIAAAAFVMFLFRYGERRFPVLEKAMWLVCLIVLIMALMVPHWTSLYGEQWELVGAFVFAAGTGWFMWRALQIRRSDFSVLAVCLILPLVAAVYEVLARFEWVPHTHLLRFAAILSALGLFFAAAFRFVAATRRVEAFNLELKREVDAATRKLGETLAREHALALGKSRAEERLQLTRDLHDGFGGTLIGAIARLEQAPDDTPKTQVVETLKDMRDDLRLVLDSTTDGQVGIADLLAPLRYRSSQLLEAAGIDSYWHLHGVDELELDGPRGLDLLRLLQEALTNVFKHSRATRVDVSLSHEDGRLRLDVRDDGGGLSTFVHRPGGAGLTSMRLRANRLGGELQIDSTEQGTRLQVGFPLTRAARLGRSG